VRERADETEAASARITEATSEQLDTVEDLQRKVDRLCGRTTASQSAAARSDGGRVPTRDR
jgi:hypothetical protein